MYVYEENSIIFHHEESFEMDTIKDIFLDFRVMLH